MYINLTFNLSDSGMMKLYEGIIFVISFRF